MNDISKNIYFIKSNINEEQHNRVLFESLKNSSYMKDKKTKHRSNEAEEQFKHLSSLQLTPDECYVLQVLKKKKEQQDKKYNRLYGK